MARQPTDDEWNKSIEDLKSFSGPGQTGLTGHMYKMLDGTNREQLIKCLNETWNRAAAGEIETAAPVAWRTGLAKILPKKPGSDNANDYRCVVLLEVSSKIISKVATKRMREHFDHNLERATINNQNGFTVNRSM